MEKSQPILKLNTRLSAIANVKSILALIKQPGQISMSSPISSQIHPVTLPPSTVFNGGNSPYEVLHSVMHFTVAPYFDAFCRSTMDSTSSGGQKTLSATEGAIPATRKKINDLETSFLHLSHSVDIPELVLTLPPVIETALEALPQGNEPTASLISAKYLNDLGFINSLQAAVNSWIKSIQGVTRMAQGPVASTANQEINFWISMESALQEVDKQLKSPGIVLTLDVLRSAKRFHATVSFLSDTGLKEATEQVQKYNQLMRDFPLEKLQNATSLEDAEEAVDEVFAHLNKRLRVVPYPIWRALVLVENISKDLNTVLVSLLSKEPLMQTNYSSFRAVYKSSNRIFEAWDENVKEFVNVAREMTRKRSEKFIPIRFVAHQKPTKDRLDYILHFRERHEELIKTIERAMNNGKPANDSSVTIFNINPIEEIADAYKLVTEVNALDTTDAGVEAWMRAEKKYVEKTTGVEQVIISLIRDRLAAAKNSNDMFLVFSTFNALFTRPSIRGAVQEYQSRLIDNVKSDIATLQNRYRQQYPNSEAYEMSKIRDLPLVSGTIIWVRQIERQLDMYLTRVEQIFGDGWKNYAEGEKLAAEANAFRAKLDVEHIFKGWLAGVTKKKVSVSGPLFRIRNQHGDFSLMVNFDPNIAALFKEVRILNSLGFQVPLSVSSVAKSARAVYHFAVSLIDAVSTLSRTIDIVNSKTLIGKQLVYGTESLVMEILSEGVSLRWESLAHAYISRYEHEESAQVKFVQDFQVAVSDYASKSEEVVKIIGAINSLFDVLRDEQLADHQVLASALTEIQEYVDVINLGSFSNVQHFVEALNNEVQQIIEIRSKSLVRSWIDAMRGKETGVSAKLPFPPKILQHELGLWNQSIILKPELDRSKIALISNLQVNLNSLFRLNKIDAFRFEVGEKKQTSPFLSVTNAIAAELLNAYDSIDRLLDEVNLYLHDWYKFQALWDVQPERIYESLGTDLEKWLQILDEIRKARSTFDTNDPYKMFGIVKIDFQPIQIRINSKYDIWQHDILLKFSQRLNNSMRDVCSEMESHRRDLESQMLDVSSVEGMVKCLTAIESCSAQSELWEKKVVLFRGGQQALSRHRFQFPPKWLFIDQVENEWIALQDILEKRKSTMNQQSDNIRIKITSETGRLNERINTLEENWQLEKPVSGSLKPANAISLLQKFSDEAQATNVSAELLCKACSALSLDFKKSSTLDIVSEEIADLATVWGALDSVWARVNDLREMPWISVVPRKLRSSLDDISSSLRNMPARIRQYAAFQHIQSVLRTLIKSNTLILDLKSDAIHERHWQSLFVSIAGKKRLTYGTMSLGDVWDLNLSTNSTVVQDIIKVAQGEQALEVFLLQVRETWSSYTLELVNYRNVCRLIRGWDELFQNCTDHLNSLAAMHHSPYFKVFEEEARMWEDRITRILALFDCWVDVQRQWVHLEGVFGGSNDIKHILPMELARFQSVNSEFIMILKAVYKSPLVSDVLNIPGIQESIERLADMLNRVQKALGEYFEKERQRFGRFYFIGDEDLLEIIGNQSDVSRVNSHFLKMFAGISSVVTENDAIVSVKSKEGEVLQLSSQISLKDKPKMVDWLTELERETSLSVSFWLTKALNSFPKQSNNDELLTWIESHPCQALLLSLQVDWTTSVENRLPTGLDSYVEELQHMLAYFADLTLRDLSPITRRKCESLIIELIYECNIVKSLVFHKISSTEDFLWIKHMRYYYSDTNEPLEMLEVRQAGARELYGFEYLGVPDKLIITPLVNDCFLTMTQALSQGLGGSPFGPAGTGKTESVKALGQALGRYVVVFCCDESFDFQSIGRILIGICKIGAWACFDEFNRLTDQILSAVSSQLESIGMGMPEARKQGVYDIELLSNKVILHKHTGIFVTMNPEYVGRNQLPDNLKRLFKSFAMTHPDKELIVEAVLYSHGFLHGEKLAAAIVPFFVDLNAQLSKQKHYDFGLRALKSVLGISGRFKRAASPEDENQILDHENSIILRAIHESVGPKLLHADVEVMAKLERLHFPSTEYAVRESTELINSIRSHAKISRLDATKSWVEKVLQLFRFQEMHSGIMLVGKSGSGKTSVYRTFLKAQQEIDGRENIVYCLDAKVLPKSSLYGFMDSTTREWTDGLFTKTLRKIAENFRGEQLKRHWIVFDGEVDPEWVENLNSVLDDNRLLTLPSGERISLPESVRLIFEVDNLAYATPATVTRCGMIWFGDDIVTDAMIFEHKLEEFATNEIEEIYDQTTILAQADLAAVRELHHVFISVIKNLLDRETQHAIFAECLESTHVMEFSIIQGVSAFFCLVKEAFTEFSKYLIGEKGSLLLEKSSPLNSNIIVTDFISRKLLLALVWSFGGSLHLKERTNFGYFLQNLPAFQQWGVSTEKNILDYEVSYENGKWISVDQEVKPIIMESQDVVKTDVVVPTIDTTRHENLIYSYLNNHKPVILCGPPGSGKTMSLFNSLRKLPNLDVVGLNFSKETTPQLLVKSLEQYCQYRRTNSGQTLSPIQLGRWLVVFCDEINLPALDKYGSQKVIDLIRQMIEHGGFWNEDTKQWVVLQNIQFVGACNPPTDVGRNALAPRFLRHSSVVFVDYPGETSLKQIYLTFNNALLKCVPSLRGYGVDLTTAMIKVYLESQKHFTTSQQSHYIYSPRELTRWCKGIYEAIQNSEYLKIEELVRIWAHEGLRLFSDRLADMDGKVWTDQLIDAVARESFPNCNFDDALRRPILYSNWLSRHYTSVEKDELHQFVTARMRTFCEEVVDVPLILYDDLLDHVLRIDRVLRQPQGHLILIGPSSSGRTTLTRFVCWMNGIRSTQLKTTRSYSYEAFAMDLRNILKQTGCYGERVCFILDESNILETSFLERMNTLLANGEVPGLFEDDDYTMLMTACREGASKQGLNLSAEDELYRWFTSQIVKNLHVVFTLSPEKSAISSRAVTSPALFNRCALNWMGDWTPVALYQVAESLTNHVDVDKSEYQVPESLTKASMDIPNITTYRQAIINFAVYAHTSSRSISESITKGTYSLTPGHFMQFVKTFAKIYAQKREDLEQQQRHFNVGLVKLKDTTIKVRELKVELSAKKEQLAAKSKQAGDMMSQMLSDQNEAERKKVASIEIQQDLDLKEKAIDQRREQVHKDLALAEPAVLEAQRSVNNIKKQHLTELRSMASPPEAVRLTLESVCVLLGSDVRTWREVQREVRREDFIPSIVKFDSETQMDTELREYMEAKYLSLPNFNFETVNRASKACGPLLQWVEAQVQYATILERVGPLREEVLLLEEEAEQTKAQVEAIKEMIEELEASIKSYTDEYASLIAETQSIKREMISVESKVERSVKLLENLSSEKARWADSVKQFDSTKEVLAGTCMLAAAYSTYCGYFGQATRKYLNSVWALGIDESGIAFSNRENLLSFMSTSDERLRWVDSSLPDDILCMENAMMLKRDDQYPYIIDPNGRALEFLIREYSGKLKVTSFSDPSFIKHLESALRFGNPILIQDAEHIDPIINPILAREYKRTGGRTLIDFGKQEIDFSNNFKLYLLTRDPAVKVASYISSRMTLVNFTITRDSLETQALNSVLKLERPDVEQKRMELVKLQSEYKIHLHQLELDLLSALNHNEGSLLDDDAIIATLERLKVEAGEIEIKVSETQNVIRQVEETSRIYQPLAKHCSKIFLVIEKLSLVQNFYQFPLQFLLEIFDNVVRQQQSCSDDTISRVEYLIRSLYVEVFRQLAPALLEDDVLSLALTFLFLYAEKDPTDKSLIALDKKEKIHKTEQELSKEEILHDLLVCKFNEPHRLREVLDMACYKMLGSSLLYSDIGLEGILGLQSAQVNGLTPVAMFVAPGQDPTSKIQSLKSEGLVTIAMGTKEAQLLAEKYIFTENKKGVWVLLQNLHMAPDWLEKLEKRIKSTVFHSDFKLLFTIDMASHVPNTFVRMCRIMSFERPSGMKTSMQSSLANVSKTRFSSLPKEKPRIYFMLAWIHSIFRERMRFVPLGWTKPYGFHDSDFESGLHVIDQWVPQSKQNISPNSIPWHIIIQLLFITVYAGRMDHSADRQCVKDTLEKLFVPEMFEVDFKLDLTDEANGPPPMPESADSDSLLQWVDSLPETESPTWLGLDRDAEVERLSVETTRAFDQTLIWTKLEEVELDL